jgi:hypothetical protein
MMMPMPIKDKWNDGHAGNQQQTNQKVGFEFLFRIEFRNEIKVVEVKGEDDEYNF